MRTMMVRHKYFKIEKLQEDTNAVLETTAFLSPFLGIALSSSSLAHALYSLPLLRHSLFFFFFLPRSALCSLPLLRTTRISLSFHHHSRFSLFLPPTQPTHRRFCFHGHPHHHSGFSHSAATPTTTEGSLILRTYSIFFCLTSFYIF